MYGKPYRGFESLSRRHVFARVLHFVQDFACGLPLRSRPHSGSSSNPSPSAMYLHGSFTSFRISPADSRSAHARIAAQVRIPLPPPSQRQLPFVERLASLSVPSVDTSHGMITCLKIIGSGQTFTWRPR